MLIMMKSECETDKIILSGMRFYGYHGVNPEEKTQGQWFEVDVELWGDYSTAEKNDNIADALNYSTVYKRVKKIVEGPSVNLIEHLAHLLMQDLLSFDQVKKALVRVKKPQAPLKGPLGYAGVEITRWRHD